MEVRASLRYYRKGPRKVRPVINLVRGLNVAEAEVQLGFMQRESARTILKLLQSAIANAENNFKLDRNNLFIKTITADGGPTIKRSRPRAQGRATPIRKRTSHIMIVLDERVQNEAQSAAVVPAQKSAETKVEAVKKPATAKKAPAKKAPKA